MTQEAGCISILGGSVVVPHDYVFDRVRAAEGDIVLVSGTLIEGIGNIHSDLDIYILVEALPKAGQFDIESHVAVCDLDDEVLNSEDKDVEVGSTYDYFGDAGLHVDVKYITYAEVYDMIGKIRSDFDNIRIDKKLYYPTMSNSFVEDQDKFLHRLQHGIALTNSEKYEAIKAAFPTREYCFTLYRQFSPNYFNFKDVQGSWISGQLPMSREISRGLVMRNMQSITHLNQNTNKTSKWIFEYVSQLPEWASDARENFRDLMSRGVSDAQGTRRYILDAMDTMDMIFTTGVELMKLQPLYPQPDECMRHLDAALDLRNQGDHFLSQQAYLLRAKNFSRVDTPLRALVDIDGAYE